MRVLGIIPARGGSKGIPRKNIYPVLGKPLIAYTLEGAQKSKLLTDCIVSSDDSEIIQVTKKFGGVAPFMRPPELATDKATTVDVVQHATRFMEAETKAPYDIIILLQVTAPLRTADDIDASINLLMEKKTDSVISVCRVDDPHPGKMMVMNNDSLGPLLPEIWHERVRRQDLPPVYFLNGAIYCMWRRVLLEENSMWGKRRFPYEMPPERSVNIDSIVDFYLFEKIIELSSAKTRAGRG